MVSRVFACLLFEILENRQVFTESPLDEKLMLRDIKQHGQDRAAVPAAMLSITVPGSGSVPGICITT